MLPDMLLSTYAQKLGALSAGSARQRRSDLASTGTRYSLRARPVPALDAVRFACQQAQDGVFRLQGRQCPPSLQALLDEAATAAKRPVRCQRRREG